MKRIFLPFFILLFFTSELTTAQTIFISPRAGYRHRKQMNREERSSRREFPKFQPSVNLSFGYGFPNVDKESLVDFSGMRRGNATQTGPLTAAIDYRFSRNMSIGALVTHGKVSLPYYDRYTGTNEINGSLDNWSFMLNIMRYISIPGSRVTPYIRTAIGVNSWKQDYTAANGSKINYVSAPSELAYQAGIGANINLSKNAGIFLEAGYGKYILHGGLSLKF